jgi:predicted transport protein
VENELSIHPVYEHMVPQFHKIINGVKSQSSRIQIIKMLYDEINKDNALKQTIIAKTGNVDVYHFLFGLFSKTPVFVVIIDEITAKLEEVRHDFPYVPEIVEFKTFIREDNLKSHSFLIEPPLYEISGQEEEPTKLERVQSWEAMLEKLDMPMRKVTVDLISRIKELGDVVFRGKTSYSAYIGQQRVKYGFAGLAPTKSALRVIIRTDQNLCDPKGLVSTKPAHWFTGKEEKQEREFKIKSEDQIDYGMSLIKQSYQLVKKLAAS